MAEYLFKQTDEMEKDSTMSGFSSDLLNEYKSSFVIWHRVSKDDDYGGYDSIWVKGASFDGILTEDTSITATVAGIDQNKNFFGIKCERTVPLEFHTIFQRVSDGRFFRITSGEVLKSPTMSRLNMQILSAEAFDPTDWEEPKEEVTGNGNS